MFRSLSRLEVPVALASALLCFTIPAARRVAAQDAAAEEPAVDTAAPAAPTADSTDEYFGWLEEMLDVEVTPRPGGQSSARGAVGSEGHEGRGEQGGDSGGGGGDRDRDHGGHD